jgi:hypothetical protein
MLTIGARHPARVLVFTSLRAVYSDAPRRALARCVGFGGQDPAATALASVRVAQDAGRLDEVQLDEVIGALVAEDYGEQAA